MTKIDFYLLNDNTKDKSSFACRLTQKAFKQGYQVYIYSDEQSQINKIDNLLWTFQQGSFLPHWVYNQADATRENEDRPEAIVLGNTAPPDSIHDVLINLSDASPDFFSSFDRVAEIVSNDESEKINARKRYQFYRDRGYELETHNI
jgi:DNA polymerase-3 subunit chi